MVFLPIRSFEIRSYALSRTILISSAMSFSNLARSASSISCARSSFSVPLRANTRALITMPRHARRHAQRAVAHVAGLFAEDRAQQLLFRRQLGLALRRDLADQHVAGADLGADAHDARLVDVLEGLFTDVRDVARDLFLAELRVASDALELLDVDRGEDVFAGSRAR